ncbi:MAG: PAS domain-containing protein [Bacteroidetes bacterium]|nr:PAS domain-containing protein [Bacteroidota bacterium]
MRTERYEIFENMLEGVQVINNNWQYIYVNNAVVEQGKTSKKKLLGKTMMEAYPGIEHTAMFKKLEKCMATKTRKKILNEFEFPDGSKGFFELRMQPVDEGVLILSLDITEQKRLEAELRKLNEYLEDNVNERTKELVVALEREKELNLIKSRFVSVASHEFKTPLGAIQISVNVLEEYNGSIPEYVQQRLELYGYIKSSVKNMFEILNDYLTLDRLEQNKINTETQTFDVAALIADEIEKIKILCKTGQKIIYTHEGNDKTVKTDKQLIKSILLNLLSNAIKYSEKNIEINTNLNKTHLKLKVMDKGIGIPKKDQKNLYQKFFRAENIGEIQGTGLGLNIVKRYVELLEGEINCISKLNNGTTFQVNIPKVKQETSTFKV